MFNQYLQNRFFPYLIHIHTERKKEREREWRMMIALYGYCTRKLFAESNRYLAIGKATQNWHAVLQCTYKREKKRERDSKKEPCVCAKTAPNLISRARFLLVCTHRISKMSSAENYYFTSITMPMKTQWMRST